MKISSKLSEHYDCNIVKPVVTKVNAQMLFVQGGLESLYMYFLFAIKFLIKEKRTLKN